MFGEMYSKYYELFNQDKPYEREIKFVYKWAEKPKWIFDIGAGTGSYWKYYPKKTNIFGVDKSPSMIENSKNRQIACFDITQYKHHGRFDCATALFDVMNYIPEHDWWKEIPIDKGGYFIFDIFDKLKVDKEGFLTTVKKIKNATRTITPITYDGKTINLSIRVDNNGVVFIENHRMFLHSHEDIEKFCGNDFEIVEVWPTEQWQTWYKLRRK